VCLYIFFLLRAQRAYLLQLFEAKV
jgi:hypothetical protein